MNIVIIGSFLLSAYMNVYILAIGAVIAAALQFSLLLPSMRKQGYKYRPVLDLNDKYIKTMVMLALPVILSQSVSRINVLVDRTLASSIVVGGISALNYSDRIGGFVEGFFVNSITTVLYPNISKMVAEDNLKGLKSALGEAISIINLVVVPATVGAMLFSKEIVSLLFGRGAFTAEAIQMTGIALFYYSLGMIPKGLRAVTSRSFYAQQDTKTPMINATIGVAINVVLNFVLSRYMGIGGLALATSISNLVICVLMFITLRKKIGPFGLKEITISFVKITIASLLMGVVAYGSFKFMASKMRENLALILAIGIGALVYAVIIYFMKIPEVDSTLIAAKKKIGARMNNKNKDKESSES